MEKGLRNIIVINEELCDGCNACVSFCKQQALELAYGKARLLSESYCDGAGNCISKCPNDALSLKMHVAVPYNKTALVRKTIEQNTTAVICGICSGARVATACRYPDDKDKTAGCYISHGKN